MTGTVSERKLLIVRETGEAQRTLKSFSHGCGLKKSKRRRKRVLCNQSTDKEEIFQCNTTRGAQRERTVGSMELGSSIQSTKKCKRSTYLGRRKTNRKGSGDYKNVWYSPRLPLLNRKLEEKGKKSDQPYGGRSVAKTRSVRGSSEGGSSRCEFPA